MKSHAAFCALALFVAAPAFADEPDGLKLPQGFHASIVAEGVGPMRHLAVRDNGDIYVSTARNRGRQELQGTGGGIIALQVGADHKVEKTEHFGAVDGGTGIRFWKGALYASSPSRIYRFTFSAKSLLPNPEPQIIVDGMPAVHGSNRALALDGKGNIYVALDGSGNICTADNAPKGAVPVGLKPCPDLGQRAGVWRFSATKQGQQFKSGEMIGTGIRDTTSLAWSHTDNALYVLNHGRDDMHRSFPNVISTAGDDAIADDMYKVTKGTDMGWPYTYWDGVKKVRLTGPEYGGDGKTPVGGNYAVPVATFQNGRAAPLDMSFYGGKQFPAEYRGGAFVALHGGGGPQSPTGHNGYTVNFIPMGKNGVTGEPRIFADGFAGPTDASKNGGGKAMYRPQTVAVGADGALYVGDSNKGRIWRITYGN